MENKRFLIVGAGMTGLAFADHIQDDDYLIVEAQSEIGGYCRTVVQDGFVWDYSGHFFHFRHPEIEAELIRRMAGQKVRRVQKQSKIWYGDRYVDFPFQKNIHQLPQEEFLECLVELFERPESKKPENFLEMLEVKFGRGIAERFLIPYNEKLYATDLARLDVEAMGRFFPHAQLGEIIRNFRAADNQSYNSTFTYPEGGAIQYVHALASDIPPSRIALNEALIHLDLRNKVAKTTKREIKFEHLISSLPFDRLLRLASLPHDPAIFSYNKVEVFNLGFDRKGPEDVHWIYYPQRELSFYRVGFYDNIFDTPRMSIYVEIGRRQDFELDASTVPYTLDRVLADLRAAGIITDQKLISSHHVLLDPAYVHITRDSIAEVEKQKALLETRGIYSMGRYGSWTYCAIEDNIVEARALADRFNALAALPGR